MRKISFFVMIGFVVSCSNTEKKVPLRYGTVRAIVDAPAQVAYQNGYFTDEGLDMSIHICPDGKTSLNLLLNDSLDIASVMSTPVVYQSFVRNDFYIFGVMEFSEKIHACLVSTQSGILTPIDLVGKRVGVLKGTSGEFFMNSFLILNEISPEDVIVVNLTGPEMVSAMVKNELDAMFCWEPYPLLAEQQMGGNSFRLESPKLIPSSWVFVAKKNYVNKNPEVLNKFLLGIMSGITYCSEHKNSAMDIHAEYTQMERNVIEELFFQESFSLSLKQELILDLEAQARWLIDFQYVNDSIVPDFLDLIYLDAMQNVCPQKSVLIK